MRQLDTAKSRVAECHQRVHYRIDLKLCSEGLKTALMEEDYDPNVSLPTYTGFSVLMILFCNFTNFQISGDG